MKFKIEDRVKITETSRWYRNNDLTNPINEIGTIDSIYMESIGVQWESVHNGYTEKDLELVEEKSNKQLAREYLYDILTNKEVSIKTTLKNRDKFYKILDHLEIKYYIYDERTLDNYRELCSYYQKKSLSQSSKPRENLSLIDFEDLLKEYKKLINKK